jgi:hypothetical protein
MKMFAIVCNELIEDEVQEIFSELNVPGYTRIAGVFGSGVSGTVSTRPWGVRNTLFMVALDEASVPALAERVRRLHERLVRANEGREVPLKAFVHECEMVV